MQRKHATAITSTYHHIRGGNNVSTGTGLANDLLTKLVDSSIIDDFAVFDNTVVSLVRVRIQGNIRHNHSVGVRCLDHANGTRHNAFRVVSLDTKVGLELIGNLGKEDKRLDSQSHGFAHLTKHRVQRVTLAARHGDNVLVEIFIVDEERLNKVGRSDNVFAHHTTNSRRLSVTTRASTLNT